MSQWEANKNSPNDVAVFLISSYYMCYIEYKSIHTNLYISKLKSESCGPCQY